MRGPLKSILLAILAVCLAGCAKTDRDHILKVYNWADYIDEGLLDEFEDWYLEQTGEEVKVIYQLFDINEVMLSKIEKGHDDYDVVCPSDYIIERMLRNDMILPIDKDFGDTPNYIDEYVAPFIKNLFTKIDGYGKDANEYAVGYMWGTTGVLYNEHFVSPEDVKSWGFLSNPEFSGRIFMKDAFRDVYSALLVYLKDEQIRSGEVNLDSLMYDSSDESIALVENFLKSIKENVAGWEADFGKEQMTKEKGWLNLTWSGDAAWAIEEAALVDVPLQYTVPQEGSNIWFDGWVIPKYARNIKAARYFINFLCMPENAIRNMDEIGYVSVISGQEILDAQIDEECYDPVDASYFFGEGYESICVNAVQYPDKSVIEHCALMHDSGERTEFLLAMWSRVKGDNATGFSFILVILFFAAMLFFGVRRKTLKARKRKRRHRFNY